MSVGIIYVKTRIRLDMDIDESEVEDFVSELDYNFSGGTVEGVNLVSDTEIVEHEAVTSDDINA